MDDSDLIGRWVKLKILPLFRFPGPASSLPDSAAIS